MSRTISSQRKGTFYLGLALVALGLLVFGSVFVTTALDFGNFSNFNENVASSMIRVVLGMGLFIVGGVLALIGFRGAAGAGFLLDPERARDDLEPFSRAAGGMIKDVLEEAEIDLGSSKEAVVMIRCKACNKLNEEDSKFCQECGAPI